MAVQVTPARGPLYTATEQNFYLFNMRLQIRPKFSFYLMRTFVFIRFMA